MLFMKRQFFLSPVDLGILIVDYIVYILYIYIYMHILLIYTYNYIYDIYVYYILYIFCL